MGALLAHSEPSRESAGGSLVVTTRNRRIKLRPEHDGSTTVVRTTRVKFPFGTRIEINFGPAIAQRGREKAQAIEEVEEV